MRSFMKRVQARVENILGVCLLALRRLRTHAGLSLSAMAGMISVLSLVICVPVFTNAILSQVLKETLITKSIDNHRALFGMHIYYRDDTTYTQLSSDGAGRVADWIRGQVTASMGLQVDDIYYDVLSSPANFKPVTYQSIKPPFQDLYMYLYSSNLVAKKTHLVEGAWPPEEAPAALADGSPAPIPIAVEQTFADESFLNVGDRLHSDNFDVQITGIFTANDPNDLAWFYAPDTAFIKIAYIPMGYFKTRLPGLMERAVNYASWYAIARNDSLGFNNSLDYNRSMTRFIADLPRVIPNAQMDYSPAKELQDYAKRLDALMVLFYAAGAPLVLLALLFISLTGSIALKETEQENTTLRGRGVSPAQLIGLNLLESAVLVLFSLPAALGLGWLAAALMGRTQLFLQFTRRPELSYGLKDVNWNWVWIVCGAILIARLLPLLGLRRVTAVSLRADRSRGSRRPVWERFFLDFALLIPAGYAYWVLRNQLKVMNAPAANGITPAAAAHASNAQYDPLMFVASALFAFAACMIVLRVFPLIMRILARLSEHFFPAGPYLAIQELARHPQEHANVMLLIMVSLSLAIYSASLARTLDLWLQAAQYFRAGSDLVIREYAIPIGDDPRIPGAGTSTASSSSPDAQQGVQVLVNLEQHLKLPGIRAATNVGTYTGRYKSSTGDREVTLMAVDRLTFTGAAFFRADFSKDSLGALMNALGAVPNGVIVPNTMLGNTGLRVGDLLEITASVGLLNQGFNQKMQIVGAYTYFPTIYPAETPVLIVNMGNIFGYMEAATDYDTWLSLQPGADYKAVLVSLKAEALKDKMLVNVRQNAIEQIQTLTGQPEWVGLFGILSVGFLLTGLMPCIGFVLDTFSTLRRHFVQLGILMAVGLPNRGVMSYLVLERLFLMAMAIGGGALVGFGMSTLFIPLLQISTAGAAPIPPFEVLIGWSEATWIIAAFGGVLLIAVIGTIAYLVRLQIFQAVKMGETV
jgi:putative ABC transport system permease protein